MPIPCGIPYIYGTLGGPDKNLIPDAVLEANRTELLVAEGIKIDRREHRLLTTDGEVQYDCLVLGRPGGAVFSY